MSCSKGSNNRSRPQKHQNRTAFKNDLHDTSKKTKFLNSMDVTGVCNRCKEIIEWKIKYKKYKPLTAPRKCISCDQKNIKHAYHILCSKCATEKKVCSKCNTLLETCDKVEEKGKENTEEVDIESILKRLPERKRRTVLRYLNKNNGTLTESEINTLLTGMDNINLDEDWSSEDLGDSDYEEELSNLK